MRRSITGSTLDPDRALGAQERLAMKIIGEPLKHNVLTGTDRGVRAAQANQLYQAGWSFADIGKAFGFSKQWAYLELIGFGYHTPGTVRNFVRRKHPQ